MRPLVDRSSVVETLGTMIRNSANGQRGVGVVVVRLENLRQLTLDRGYDAGARLLAQADKRIESLARRRDWIARIGDQDFVLLLPDILGAGQIHLCANKLQHTVDEESQVGDDVLPMCIRVGAALCPDHGFEPQELLRAAERSALRAEERRVFLELHASSEKPAARRQMEGLFDRAFERGEFELHYQAKINLASRATVGAEALSRWFSRELGHVSPTDFIPAAERSGHIEQLTWSCINAALQQTAAWRAEGRDFKVAVNLSAVCLDSPGFSERVRNAIALWSVPPQVLTLELTESAIMRNPAKSFAILRGLRELGVHVSIDDFGTGYSSLAYFRELPADELKIDRSFVMNVLTSTADRHLVQTIIDLAHRFNQTVVAEGIENGETTAALTEMGCDLAQGFYLAKPVPAGDFWRG